MPKKLPVPLPIIDDAQPMVDVLESYDPNSCVEWVHDSQGAFKEFNKRMAKLNTAPCNIAMGFLMGFLWAAFISAIDEKEE